MTTQMQTARAAGRAAHTDAPPLLEHYRAVRRRSERLIAPLSPEDAVVQAVEHASPAKWHVAHVTWFFETIVLREHLDGYEPFDERFPFLFNSYYNALGERIPRHRRGLITRPTLDEVMAYRAHVDEHMGRLLGTAGEQRFAAVEPLVTIGLNHEQQHQELMLTDIKATLHFNPLRPVYRPRDDAPAAPPRAMRFIDFPGGLETVGHDPAGGGFAYDNESPRHQVFVHPFALADRLVTSGEFMAFIDDGGYERPDHWLDLGWATAQREGWGAPAYWERQDGRWRHYTLAGMQDVDPHLPVTHVSYFEADAYANWAGNRLPTEFEWETASASVDDVRDGGFVESQRFHSAPAVAGDGLRQMFGDAWEWTRSHYSPYPGYRPEPGALGEYNGKFMCNQFVLRGGSCATPASHVRRTYRNFWAPQTRFQFSGIRLAEDRR